MIFNNYPFSLFTTVDVGGIMIIVAVATTIFSGYDYLRKNIEIIRVGK
jgi:hypothetical protein